MLASESNPYQPPPPEGLPASQSIEDTEFVLSGCLTLGDALAANRLATRGFWALIALSLLTAITFSIVLIAVAVSSRPYSPEAANVILLVACMIFPLLFAVPYAIGLFRLHRFARKHFGIFAPTQSTFSSSKIVCRSESARSEFEWSFFSRCIANESVALLYFKNSNQFLILARQKLNDPSQWNEFLSMIQSQLEMAG